MEETAAPGVNHRPVASHWQTLSHKVVSSTPRLSRIRTHNVSGDSVAYTLQRDSKMRHGYFIGVSVSKFLVYFEFFTNQPLHIGCNIC